MAVILLAIMLIGLLLIATESLNRINKAAVAMFAGVVCWLLFIVYGADFISIEHNKDYAAFLSANPLAAFPIRNLFRQTFSLSILCSVQTLCSIWWLLLVLLKC